MPSNTAADEHDGFSTQRQHRPNLSVRSHNQHPSVYESGELDRSPSMSHRPRTYLESPTYFSSRPSSAGTSEATLRPVSPANTSAKLHFRAKERQIDPLGLTVLHEPQESALADLVFIHGLGGGSRQTWSDGEGGDTFWPRDWLPEEQVLKTTRISAYGYNTQLSRTKPDSIFDISGVAKDLLQQLRYGTDSKGLSLGIGDGNVPLILISHSTGGLVAKKAYLLCKSNANVPYADIARAITGFVFFATPHRGLHSPSVLSNILSATIPDWHPNYHGNLIDSHLTEFQNINDQFRNLAASLDIVSMYEREAVPLTMASHMLVLPEDLATLQHPSEDALPMQASHLTITKFRAPTDPNYKTVLGVLRDLVSKHKVRKKSPAPEDVIGQTQKVQKLLIGGEAPEEDLAFFATKRMPGSCEWVIEHPLMISLEASVSMSPQVLWCYGSPGSGKSVTSTYMIEQLLERRTPCAYYFFRSGNQINNSLTRFLISAAYQLAECIPEYRRRLTSIAEEHNDLRRIAPRLLWKHLFMTALSTCGTTSPFYLILDGIDELPPSQAQDLLLKMLNEVGTSRMPLRLLLVSRPTPDIETCIDRMSRSGKLDVQRLALDLNSQDLEAYVQEEMSVMVGDDEFKTRTQENILKKASSNFLWAHLVVQEILECETEAQVEKALAQIPKELEPLYERMEVQLADITRSKPEARAMGRMIMMWATCARRPLLLEELQTALSRTFPGILNMRHSVQRLCRDFVVVDKRGQVSVMHASAKEFLMSRPDLQYYINSRRAHQTLFTECVQALTNMRREQESVQQQARNFVHYAASSWPFHLSHSSDCAIDETLSTLSKLFKDIAVLRWIHLLVRANNLRAVVEASKAIADFIRLVDKLDKDRNPLTHRLAEKEHLNAWAHDLIRVVGKFGPQLTQHPGAIFNIVPAFCPTTSAMHKQFGSPSSTASSLQVRGAPSVAWDDCFAKFPVPSEENQPRAVLSLGRYIAILTNPDGALHLHYATTCELARTISHRETVLAFCADSSNSKVATYAFRSTKLWDVESGRQICSIENPSTTKALTLTFRRNFYGELELLSFSDDRRIRSCALDAVRRYWSIHGDALVEGIAYFSPANSPRAAAFSPGGKYLAVSYRAADPSVWALDSDSPTFIASCDHRSRRSSLGFGGKVTGGGSYVQSFSWNPVSGHLLGIYNDGLLFQWHPIEGFYDLSEVRCTHVKCSADGKLFVTGSGDGQLRIWNSDHFAPIYQLRFPVAITDLDLAANEARIYDIRESYCTIWEPVSLLRAMDTEDRASDRASESQVSMISEAVQEDFVPITSFSAKLDASVYAAGHDDGLIEVSDLDGNVLAELADNPDMSIERLAWSPATKVLVSLDLARGVKVQDFRSKDGRGAWRTGKVVRSFTEPEQALQVVFNTSGETLLIATPSVLKFVALASQAPPAVIPMPKRCYWIAHPLDQSLMLGFGADQITVVPWAQPLQVTAIPYESAAEARTLDSVLQRLPRRPSQGYPLSPSEVERVVNKAIASPDGRVIFFEIFTLGRRVRRRSDCLLVETAHLMDGQGRGSIKANSIAPNIAERLLVSLGFVRADAALLPDLPVQGYGGYRRPSQRHREDSYTFVFIDKDFWLCSAGIDIAQHQYAPHIRRHFFLPRDWQNIGLLEIATVTPAGDFLCPRSGHVGVVSNGIFEEHIDPEGAQRRVG